eukprot:12206723-Heterocapsa_arctica.AAC.1
MIEKLSRKWQIDSVKSWPITFYCLTHREKWFAPLTLKVKVLRLRLPPLSRLAQTPFAGRRGSSA